MFRPFHNYTVTAIIRASWTWPSFPDSIHAPISSIILMSVTRSGIVSYSTERASLLVVSRGICRTDCFLPCETGPSHSFLLLCLFLFFFFLRPHEFIVSENSYYAVLRGPSCFAGSCLISVSTPDDSSRKTSDFYDGVVVYEVFFVAAATAYRSLSTLYSYLARPTYFCSRFPFFLLFLSFF